MASVQNLKKDVNYVISDIIEECYIWQLIHEENQSKKAEKLIDEAIEVFDDLIARINTKKVENKKLHFKAINQDLETKASDLINKLAKL
ncbi:MAG: hypothetical protein COV50_02415 [Flavobacteriales bacterium CG11_big_fil_rev_8_21_14_0_20_35_7]|nr:MAG: hypothetical protein COV50_02415 [Flavobacteriales bacterium CG11_big_fil_rev_8_21_14_0_20_35_7]